MPDFEANTALGSCACRRGAYPSHAAKQTWRRRARAYLQAVWSRTPFADARHVTFGTAHPIMVRDKRAAGCTEEDAILAAREIHALNCGRKCCRDFGVVGTGEAWDVGRGKGRPCARTGRAPRDVFVSYCQAVLIAPSILYSRTALSALY